MDIHEITRDWLARRPATTRKNGFLFALILPLAIIACPGSSSTSDSNRNLNSNTERTASSTGSLPGAPASETTAPSPKVVFDENRAFADLRKQVEFGPRPAGSSQLAATREYIVSELKAAGLTVRLDEWRPSTPVGPLNMVNIVATLPGESTDMIVLGSHYDTKLFKQFRFVGADDGASSTAVLLELARDLAASHRKSRFTYEFAFFDGEEAVCEGWEECGKPGAPDNTYGSRHFVEQLKEKNEVRNCRAFILMDMIGYKNLEMGRDDMSTPWLIDIVWQTAHELGYSQQFLNRVEPVGGDDHEPFLKAGIDSLDLIQLSTYKYWHTPEDTLDKVSARSLKIIGEVVLASLPRIEQHLIDKRGTA